MFRENTMSKGMYLFDCAYGTFIAFILHKAYLFRCLCELTRSESLTLLWVSTLFFLITGIIVTWEKGRNAVSALVNVCFPFGVYTAISYLGAFPVLIGALSVCAVILSLIYCILIASRRIHSTNTIRISHLKAAYCLFGSKSILSLFSTVICVVLVANLIFGNSLIPPKVTPKAPSKEAAWTIAGNIDTVMKLQEDEWEKLSVKEKVDTMQVIANIEAEYLGLSHELNVALEPLGEITVAHYRDSDHTIVFNIDYFEYDSPYEVLDTICHEAYHAYQHRLCDAYDSTDESYRNLLVFHNVQKFKEEFDNYTSGDEDFKEYYTQKCESSARAYGASGSSAYLDAIEEAINCSPEADMALLNNQTFE